MEDNEKEVIDETIDESQEDVNEVEETDLDEGSDDSPTLEDYQKLKKERETLLAQKAHWKKKAETSKEDKPSNKSNETQPSISREEAILFAKGYTEDEVDLAIKLSKINNITVSEAVKDDYFTNKVDSRIKKEKSANASLAPSSKGNFKGSKPYKEMTEEERVAQFNKAMGN